MSGKIKKFFKNLIQIEGEREQVLLDKVNESIMLALIDLIVLIGIGITFLISHNLYVKNLMILVTFLLLFLIFIICRYLYYYKSADYEVITGTCIDVSCNTVSKTLKKECVVYLKDDNGKIYRFTTQYKKMIYDKGNLIKVIVPKDENRYERDGVFYLDNILVKQLVQLQEKKPD